jgi:hypothetical protein
MRNVSAADLVSAWEHTLGRPPVEQALVLLSLSAPGDSPEALARLSLGDRDGRLLTLREQLFGPELSGLTRCPQCGQRLDLCFGVDDLRLDVPALPAGPDGELEVAAEGYRVRFRLPNSADVVSAREVADPDAARQHVLDRCIRSIEVPGESPAPHTSQTPLPAPVADAVVARMSEADPQADIRLEVACPDCRHQWVAGFDIAAYLVRELHDWAVHLLQDVHTLARAYGWREADILAMSTARRQAYLQLVSQG